MRIGLDVMGGDRAPDATVKGAILAHKALKEQDSIVLIGDEKIIRKKLKELEADENDFGIVHAEQTIQMGEHPTKAYKLKTDSSINVGFRLLSSGEIDSFASAGNSGAMLVGSIYSVKAVEGIARPATAGVFPRQDDGNNIFLDVGTNVDTKPEHLFQFAILGNLYAQHVFHIDSPRVGLLNIGEEKEKGNFSTKAAYPMMEKSKTFNFIGNIEGRDLLRNKADVIVCDGFTGNVVLKQTEAFFRIITKRGLTDDYLARFNYENYGGTPVLGVNAPVILGHGISNDVAIKNMLMHAMEVWQADLPAKIKTSVSKNFQNG
ncbi:MAG: phosphate acyltransferase PlsX [Bacteroidales bacterium]|nr:phosphate acyltransferase PlsX [Bacteroidales bacterium]MCF8337450.1 phosphate acyltransferase PlsX [Bacteroidales bacterium]